MVVAFRRNCHGPRKLVGRFRFEGVHCRLWSRSDRAPKKRRTVSGSDLIGVLTRAPSLVNPERNMVAAFYLASLLCASYVPAAPRGAPLRAASRVAAPMMMPIGVPKVAYRVPGSAYADWVSNLIATTRCSLLVLLHHRLILHLRRQIIRRHHLLRCPSS